MGQGPVGGEGGRQGAMLGLGADLDQTGDGSTATGESSRRKCSFVSHEEAGGSRTCRAKQRRDAAGLSTDPRRGQRLNWGSGGRGVTRRDLARIHGAGQRLTWGSGWRNLRRRGGELEQIRWVRGLGGEVPRGNDRDGWIR